MSEKERQSRLSILNKYTQFLDKTADKILEEHHNDMIQKNPLDIKNIGTNQINGFYQYLIGEKNEINDKMIKKSISSNSARQYCYSKIPSYFRKNNVSITFQKGDVPKQEKGKRDKVWRRNEKKISKDYKKECLKQIRDTFQSLRDKAILLSKISSGMDDVDLFNVKISDYNKGIDLDSNVCELSGLRQKSKMPYHTFLNSEAVSMIELYLKERETNKEQLNDNSCLFVSLKAYKIIENESGEVIERKFRKIKDNAFSQNLKTVCKQLEIYNVSPKSLRRWFKSEMRRNSVESEVIKRMMGHKTDISADYEEMFEDNDEFLDEYIENLESITLLGNGNHRISEVDKKVDELKDLNKKLVNELAETNKKVDKMDEAIKKAIEILPMLNNEIISLRKSNKDIWNTLSDKYEIKYDDLFPLDIDDDILNLLDSMLDKAPTDNIPKEKNDIEVKGFNLKSHNK